MKHTKDFNLLVSDISNLSLEFSKQARQAVNSSLSLGPNEKVGTASPLSSIPAKELLERLSYSHSELLKKLGNQSGDDRFKILGTMKNNPKITGRKLAEMLGISITAIEKNIKYLRENGYLERMGGTPGFWKVLDE